MAFSSAISNSDLDVLVTDLALTAMHSEEPVKQRLELLLRGPSMDENLDNHAGVAKPEVDFAPVCCLCFVVAVQTPEVRLVGTEALPVAVGADRIFHWLRS